MKTHITRYFLVATVITFSCFSFITTVLAQTTPCGQIIYFDHSEPIADCEDPFAVLTPGQEKVVIMNEEVTEGETVYTTSAGVEYYYPVISRNDFYRDVYFRHENGNLVEVDSEYREITLEDYRRVGLEYFGDATTAEPYAQFQMGEDIDTDSPTWDWDAYDAYNDLCQARFEGWRTPLTPGTYTAVFQLVAVSVYNNPANSESWSQKMWSYIIPTAHAQFANSSYGTVTFTIAEEVVEPTGASSVLFLPGIQASRLYTDGIPGTENQAWEPNANSDVNDLRMSASGGSIHDIYTKDVVDEVAFPIFGGNIYKGFLGMLEDLVDDEVIKDYEAFAYDWRYDVEDVVLNGTKYENEVRSVVAKVEELAEDSYSGKVTVIGHSNGGLVAKVLINELERLGKADLVDKVVFIGTPHLGTPKAIATVLHGYDQQKLGGSVIEDNTARAIIQNMPGVYGLLPSQRYLELANEPVITVLDGPATSPMYEAFGGEVEGIDEYRNILNGLEGRTDDFANISNPYRTNPLMLQEALDLHAELDYWEAPEGIEVFNLVGVGLPTVRTVEYRNVTERINCIPTIFGGSICDTVNILRPYAHFTQYGDNTVTSLSSKVIVGEVQYLDLAAFNDSFFNPLLVFEHANITEVDGVQSFVKNILNSTTTQVEYITETQPEFNREYEVTSIDSPVRIVKEDSDGNKTGVVMQDGVAEIVTDIPGSEYVEFGGTKYVIVPKDEDVTTYLYGEDYGSYTLTTATLSGDEQVIDTQIIDATTTPTMVAQYEYIDGSYSTILTDYDGDGTTDLEMTVSGEVIPEPELTFDVLRAQILDLGLSKSRVNPLLLLVNLAEKAEKLKAPPKISKRISERLLMQLKDIIKLYAKKGWITQEQRDVLVESINRLLSK
ncbi:hypothetical protein A2Z56_03915 [Candidatus Kaiserbacteria bacterium RIFCSPHIGHO2_12_45_16]|nr:MAG: hypothetical protein A2Z56_03915 [Candidatus Kaiserbacteria bacterium RIFCSPHIGHO2_12_45_16]